MTRDTTADADVMVERPPHYHGVTRAGRRIEVIDVIEGYGLGYHLGNAVKYLCRAGRKTCDPRRDLGKARWYVRRAAVQSAPLARLAGRSADAPTAAEVAEAFGLGARAAMALGRVLTACPHRTDMDDAAQHLTVAIQICDDHEAMLTPAPDRFADLRAGTAAEIDAARESGEISETEHARSMRALDELLPRDVPA